MVMNNQLKSFLSELEQVHSHNLEIITRLLAEITKRNPEEIKPHLNMMLETLVKPHPFYETATSDEWVAEFEQWVQSHRELNLPTLSEADISREGIYGERG
jgi:hypothetical protein